MESTTSSAPIKKADRLLRLASLAAAFVVMFLLFSSPKLVFAQDGSRVVTDDEVNDVAKDLFCPVCESTPLDVCPTQACADWREVIRTKLSQGESPEEIRAYFAEQYGVRALAEPPREGFTSAIWILPIAAVLFGAVFFARYLRNLRATSEGPVAFNDSDPGMTLASERSDDEPPLDEYEARIERELRGS
jgi:cytochrome c-type biogenesis protein CcmH